jgi:hypothetical protein
MEGKHWKNIQWRQQKHFDAKSSTFLKLATFLQKHSNLSYKWDCQDFVAYSIADDDSTDFTDTDQLDAFIWRVN